MCLWRKTESRSSSVCYHNGPLLQMKALISFVHVIIHNRGYDGVLCSKNVVSVEVKSFCKSLYLVLISAFFVRVFNILPIELNYGVINLLN